MGRARRSARTTSVRVMYRVMCFLMASVALLSDSYAAHGIGPEELAVVINANDPLSIAVGEYYAKQRHIPQQNVIRILFNSRDTTLDSEEFAAAKRSLDAQLVPNVQALALTWAQPYRVECMSVTSAFAMGFDPGYCAEGCKATRLSRYFNSNSTRPYDDYRMRPAMSIAATTYDRAKALIDRGVAADAAKPTGSAYLISTDDMARNVRARTYADARMLAGDQIHIEEQTYAADRSQRDVMFYFIGAARVETVGSNKYLPGAIADHLTSLGGMLTDSPQMSSLRWLEAGATGSYGAVTEPCNITAKFPNPGLLMKRYLDGETLIEAYWKSVAMPGQGIFIGEPLARPYGH